MKNPAHLIQEFWPSFNKVVADCESVVEFGCGHGNNLRYTPAKKKVGVEKIEEYLRFSDDVEFIVGDALEEAQKMRSNSFDLVLLIDVVEHFTKNDGWLLIHHAKRIARKRILLWIPEGMMVQDREHYDHNQPYTYHDTQEHKSAWFRQELADQGFDVAAFENYHVDKVTNLKNMTALFGTWEPEPRETE